MKTKILLLSTLLLFIFGCARNLKKNVRFNGQSYNFVSAARTNSNGIITVELWEKSDNTNVYYTPSLDGKNMISIMK